MPLTDHSDKLKIKKYLILYLTDSAGNRIGALLKRYISFPLCAPFHLENPFELKLTEEDSSILREPPCFSASG